MEYRTLGRTGIRVSAVAMGCEGFEEKDYPACERLVDAAMEQGVQFFDMYTSNPDVRSHVGRALSRYPREQYVIQGHLCTTWQDGQ